MSYATKTLLRTLHYDKDEQSIQLSSKIDVFAQVASSFRTAFNNDEVEITQVTLLREEEAFLSIDGIAKVAGHGSCHLHLEFGLQDNSVESFLLLIQLPEENWPLGASIPAVQKHPALASLQFVRGYMVVSHGVYHNEFIPFPLRDGLQWVAEHITNEEAVLEEAYWAEARQAGMPTAYLPDRDTKPNADRIGIYGNMEQAWLEVQAWWINEDPGVNADRAAVHATGLGLLYNLAEPGREPQVSWLRELGPTENPILLEAPLIKGQDNTYYPVRYTSQMGHRVSLGEGLQALHSIIGEEQTTKLFGGLELPIPEAISLISLSYAPGEWMILNIGVGDSSGGTHLVEIGPFNLDEVDFNFRIPLDGQAKPAVEFTGKMSFLDIDFSVHVRPWDLIEGGLADPEGIHLGALVERALSVPLPFGLDTITLRRAWLRRYLGGKKNGGSSTSLELRLDGAVELLSGAIGLSEIKLMADIPDKGTTTGRFEAQLKLGPVGLRIQAEREVDGWILEGTANAPAEGISLTQLVDHFVRTIGASVPSEVPDVRLQTVSIRYETESRILDLQAITNWTIDGVPVISGRSTVLLQLTLAPDSLRGGRNATFAIDWMLNKGDGKYSLSANAVLSREYQSFGFDFKVPGEPLTLSTVLHDLEITEEILILDDAVEIFDHIFQVSSFSLNYSRPGNAIEVAWTRPLGSGMLLAEYSQSSALPRNVGGNAAPMSGRSRHVAASWLGRNASSTIGITDVLSLFRADDTWNDLKALPVVGGITEEIEEILTFRQLGFSWDSGNGNSVITVTALSTFTLGGSDVPAGDGLKASGTRAFLAISRGERQGIIAGISLVEEAVSQEADHAQAAASPKTGFADHLTFLPEELRNGVREVFDLASEVLEHVQITHLLVSTIQSRAYQPPAYSHADTQPGFANPGLPASTPFGSQMVAVSKGLALGVRVRLGDNDLLRQVLDFDVLEGHITLGDTIGIQCSIPGSLRIGEADGNQLVLSRAMLQLKAGAMGVEFDIAGALDIHLFGENLSLEGWLSLTPEAVMGHLKIKELPGDLAKGIPILPGVHFEISEAKPLYLEAGYQFVPPGVTLGLQGHFYICSFMGEEHDRHGELGVVLEVVGIIPTLLYIEFYLDHANLMTLIEMPTGMAYYSRLAEKGLKALEENTDGEVAETAGDAGDLLHALQDAAGHVEAILDEVHIEDTYIRFADSIVNLPDGTTATPGISLKGKLSIFGWEAFAMIDVSMGLLPGFIGHFETEPLNLGDAVKITGDGKGMREKPRKGEDPMQKDAAPAGIDTSEWYLEPGGPIFHLSTKSSPFLHANLRVEILDVFYAEVTADITTEGFEFDFIVAAGLATNGARAHLNCHWWREEGRFEASGQLGFHLHGALELPIVDETIDLNTDFDGHIYLSIDKNNFNLTVNGSFQYDGMELTIPELVIHEDISALTELVGKVWDQITEAVDFIFDDIIGPAVELIGDGVDAAKEITSAAIRSADETLDEASQETAKLTVAYLQEQGIEPEEILRAKDELETKAQKLINDAEKAAEEFAEDAAKEVAALTKKTAEVVEQTAQAVHQALDEAKSELNAAVAYGKQKQAEIILEAKQKLREVEDLVLNYLEEAGIFDKEQMKLARQAVAAINRTLDEVIRDLERLEDLLIDLANKALEVGGEVADDIAGAARGVTDGASWVWDHL